MSNGKYEDLLSVIAEPKYKTILVASHRMPDSDALFSVRYITDMLNSMGKKAIGAVGRNASSDVQAYCDHFKTKLPSTDTPLNAKVDLLFLVDCQYDKRRIEIPPDVNIDSLDVICLDAHRLVGEESLAKYKAYLIDDSVRATASLIVANGKESEFANLGEEMATLAKLAIYVDTNKMDEATKGDKYASYVFTKNANEGLVLNFITPKLSREGVMALNEALLTSTRIGDCEFIYVKNLKPENKIVIPLAAEQLLRFPDSKQISIAAGFISGDKPSEHRIDISVRDRRPIMERMADQLARSLFEEGGGDSYKAGACWKVPIFERCIYNQAFADLMRKNIEKIIQKSGIGMEFTEESIDATAQVKEQSLENSLKGCLLAKTLTKEGLAISTRAQMNYQDRGKFTTSYINLIENDQFSPAIKQEDLQAMQNAHEALMKLENTDGCIVYGLVSSMNKQYILGIVADRGKNNYGMDYEKLSKAIFGNFVLPDTDKSAINESAGKEAHTIIKIDIPGFLRQVYPEPLLSRIVFEEFESRLDSVLGESHFYKSWKEQYIKSSR